LAARKKGGTRSKAPREKAAAGPATIPPRRPAKSPNRSDTAANTGFEEKLSQGADKLRAHMGAAEYKHVVLGPIFLNWVQHITHRLAPKGVACFLLANGSMPSNSSGTGMPHQTIGELGHGH